ncbi:hypothetical protein [Nocardia farcinica]|uniref:hypothetical protein n=1 Tax=Nocardia farcinica TaxID=37329 RepID=UPI0034480C01
MTQGQPIPALAVDDLEVRALWAVTRCDPDDPQPPWEDLHPDEQANWCGRWARLRAALIAQNWTPPPAPAAGGRWHSAREIPDGTIFRPIGSVRVYKRRGDRAIQLEPAASSVTFLLSNLDADPTHYRGYTEAL